MTDTQIRDDQTSQSSDEGHEDDANSSKITFNAKTLAELQDTLRSLDEFPEHTPEHFDVIYIELEGKVGDQLVTAQYEDGEWSLTLDGASSASDEDEDKSKSESGSEKETQDAY